MVILLTARTVLGGGGGNILRCRGKEQLEYIYICISMNYDWGRRGYDPHVNAR